MKNILFIIPVLFASVSFAGGLSSSGGAERYILSCQSSQYLLSIVEWDHGYYANLVTNPTTNRGFVGKDLVVAAPSTSTSTEFRNSNGAISFTLHYANQRVDSVRIQSFNNIKNETIICETLN